MELQLPSDPSLRSVIEELRSGRTYRDDAFDRIYPEEIRQLSAVHWTPVWVAHRAAEFLTKDRPNARILDVGSGAGKFCFVGALTSSGLFDGIEQRPHFVSLARRIAWQYRIPRVRFIHGTFTDLDWSGYRGVYLFNPFQENLNGSPPIDRTVERFPALHRKYVADVRDRLRSLSVGSRIATYWGFGGRMPREFERIGREMSASRGFLEFWEKRS